MKNATLRALLCLGLGVFACARSSAQSVVLTIDYSDLSAVKVTATGNFSAIDYPNGGSNTWGYGEGIALRNFFTSPVQVQDFVGTVSSSTLTDSNNSPTSSSIFNEMSSWNDDHPEYWSSYGVSGTGNGVDITLWNQDDSTGMNFSSSSGAFNGQAVFDLTGYSAYTSLFPALNATGDVRIWNDDGGSGNSILGTWKVVGAAAIPEPSTYAALLGLVALGTVSWCRRRQKQG